MLIVYFGLLFLLLIYSYALVDPNFTLFNHWLWEDFRNFMVNLGYYQRELSLGIFFLIVIALSFFNWYLVRQNIKPMKLAMIIAGILLFSYPFLSHDFFNYLFDAKILTFYGQNPYLHKALDFPNDPWLRFMHWTHRTYPYGPIFLLLSLIPSFFSFGKLFLAFVFFKVMFAFFYLVSVWALDKLNRLAAIFFATSPLVIIEGLVNNHNDLLGISLAILSLYIFQKIKKPLWALILLLFSVGIKYVTIVFVPLVSRTRIGLITSFFLFISLLIFLYTRVGIHPWYLLNFFVFLPVLKKNYMSLIVFGFGLLMSYYPYLLFGGWDQSWKVDLKEWIIFGSISVFVIWEGLLFAIYQRNKKYVKK